MAQPYFTNDGNSPRGETNKVIKGVELVRSIVFEGCFNIK